MKVRNINEAWAAANKIFSTDYAKDETASSRAGYPVYWSTAYGVNAWISDLGDRLEVNQDGETVNIWIEDEETTEATEKKYFKVSFEHSAGVYCANIAHAASQEDAEKHYSKYEWFSVKEATPADVEEAQRKGMPFVEVETEATAAAETENETETTTEAATEPTEPEEMENSLYINFQTETRKNGERIQKEISASLNLSAATKLADILNFEKAAKAATAAAFKAIKAGQGFTYEVYSILWKRRPARDIGAPGYLEKVSCNGWQAVPVYEQGDEGLYLAPDTRYTPESHDLYIESASRILHELAEYASI